MEAARSCAHWPCVLMLLVLFGPALQPRAGAEEFAAGFDEPETSWRASYQQSEVRLISQIRDERQFVAGQRSEAVVLSARELETQFRLEHTLPAARVIDDLELSLWVRSTQGAVILSLRIVFPNQKDPRTGERLTIEIDGDRYDRTGRWQELKCKPTRKQIDERVRVRLAALRLLNIDVTGSYVDRAIVTLMLSPGMTQLNVDELRFGPVIPPTDEGVQLAAATTVEDALPARFEGGRLRVSGHAFFPRLTTYHGEHLDALSLAGLNLIWIPDYRNRYLLDQLSQHGLWAAAVPPRAVSASGQILEASQAGLMPFPNETSPILAWMLGMRIPPDRFEEVRQWSEQVHGADRRFKRPLMADVGGLEYVYSKNVDILGISRRVLNTSLEPKEYREWLLSKRKRARPGTFLFTWIQTEPSEATTEEREAAHLEPIVIEPEQIRLQTYSALAAGCRGIGFWKSTPLDGNSPGALERFLMMTQLNLEIQLIEPWLATGNVLEQVPVQPGDSTGTAREVTEASARTNSRSRRNLVLWSKENKEETPPPPSRPEADIEAALIRTEFGLLLLPIWYERNAHYVPGRMTARNVTILVPGVDETASAWEVSTTGIRSLMSTRGAGGLEITLDKFDQTGAIIVTTDQRIVTELRNKIAGMRQQSSWVCNELAKNKLKRVRQVDAELRELGVPHPQADERLAQSQALIQQAERAHHQGDYNGSRELSADAMQLMRLLQRSHWDLAAGRLASPVSSMHTVSFQSLPDHWRMVARVGQSPINTDANLLRSGDFEDIATYKAENWDNFQNEIPGVRAISEFYPLQRQGNYCLRLAAVSEPGSDVTVVPEVSPVVMTTPHMRVYSGQILHVSGWVRVVEPIVGTSEGAMIFDNIGGVRGAIRLREQTGWQRFELIREVRETGMFTVTITLNGLGEIQLDDMQVVPHDPPLAQTSKPETEESPAEERSTRERILELLEQLPRLNPMRSKE